MDWLPKCLYVQCYSSTSFGDGGSDGDGGYLTLQNPDERCPDTMLLVHFFGLNGKQVLNYTDFHR